MLSCLSFVGSMRDTNYNQLDELCDRGICIIIPTYNNEKTIVEVVQRAMEQCRDVIVVNDGSTDATTELLHAVKGITLVEYDNNKGKGKALQLGFRKALEMGFSYAITLDADNQHYPEDIPVLLEANKKYPGCFVLGRRNLSGISLAQTLRNQWADITLRGRTGVAGLWSLAWRENCIGSGACLLSSSRRTGESF